MPEKGPQFLSFFILLSSRRSLLSARCFAVQKIIEDRECAILLRRSFCSRADFKVFNFSSPSLVHRLEEFGCYLYWVQFLQEGRGYYFALAYFL